MARIKIDVDTSKLDRKMRALDGDLKRTSETAVKKLGNLARNHARQLAPRDTGWTIQNIILQKANANEVVVLARNPTASDGHLRGPLSKPYFTRGRFNLVRWMHESPSAPSHIRTGDPRFMYTTAAHLQQIAAGTVAGDFEKVVVRFNNT